MKSEYVEKLESQIDYLKRQTKELTETNGQLKSRICRLKNSNLSLKLFIKKEIK